MSLEYRGVPYLSLSDLMDGLVLNQLAYFPSKTFEFGAVGDDFVETVFSDIAEGAFYNNDYFSPTIENAFKAQGVGTDSDRDLGLPEPRGGSPHRRPRRA